MVTTHEIHEAFMELYPMGEKEQYYGAKLDFIYKSIRGKVRENS